MRLLDWAQDLIDFCYPGTCSACESACDGTTPLCDECLQKLSALEAAPGCPACGMPLPQIGSPCPYCAGKGAAHYQRIVRLATFEDPLKVMIHHIKYHNRWALAEQLADRLWAQARVKELLRDCDAIMPIPLHPLRQIARGYNQAELIARRLARHSKKKLLRGIVRLRRTPTQTHLHSKDKRMQNLRDAFGLIEPDRVYGRRIVVVDDVMTTGATLQSAARTIVEGKPSLLNALVVAIADPKHREFQAV